MNTRKVAVIGTGYVGTGMVSMFQRAFDVRTYDTKYTNADRNQVQGCDLAVICVPTPMGPDGGADITAVLDVASWIDAPLVVVKSTVPPGTTDGLNRIYGDGRFHFSPEYMGEPRNYVPRHKYPDPREPHTHDFVIVGGPRASEVLDFFLAVMAIDARYVATTSIAAELAKYMENTYFATKVTFCNEWARIAKNFGVDYKHLRELWLLDPRMEADHTAVFSHSPGFGGKCLPKDLAAIIYSSAAAGFYPELLMAVQEVNDNMRGQPVSPIPAPVQLSKPTIDAPPAVVEQYGTSLLEKLGR